MGHKFSLFLTVNFFLGVRVRLRLETIHITYYLFLSLYLCISGKKVGRITELPKPEEVIEQVEIRTIAASPFEYNVKLEEVESFFGQLAKVILTMMPWFTFLTLSSEHNL